MVEHLDIGMRMKEYEVCCHPLLPSRIPVIIRIDGRAFHTITRKRFGRGWSQEFAEQMAEMAMVVQNDVQGCNFAYSQSDEVSFLLTDYRTVNTSGWFGYDVNKMVSISASLAASVFSRMYGKCVCFDSRAFSIPQDDICNYFLWRQLDATRNSVQMLGREHFSHKQLHKLSCNMIQEKLWQEKQINFNDCPAHRKRGFCIVDGKTDWQPPIFSQEREYIERFVQIRED